MKCPKLPKTIIVCGVNYHIKQEPSSIGGSFDEATLTITIGTKFPEDVMDSLVHEVQELIYTKRKMRLIKEVVNPDNGDYFFVFNHEQFELAVGDFVAAMKGVKF